MDTLTELLVSCLEQRQVHYKEHESFDFHTFNLFSVLIRRITDAGNFPEVLKLDFDRESMFYIVQSLVLCGSSFDEDESILATEFICMKLTGLQLE